MTTHTMHTLCTRLTLGLGIALAAPCAFAVNHTIHWLEMSPTPFGSTVPLGGTFNSSVAGIGPVSMGYTPGSGLSTVRLAHPLLQNGSLLASNQDSYSWGAQELLETVAETTTTATILGLLGSTQNLGDYGSSNNWGQTVVTPGPNSLTLVNSQTGLGGADPWWNTGLNLTVLNATTPIYTLSVMFDQTLGDGVGVNIGFINAVPEPGTWALLAAGLAAVGWLGRRRERA